MFTEDGSCIYEPSAVLRTAEQASVEGPQLADL
jgi:hypothetical protein